MMIYHFLIYMCIIFFSNFIYKCKQFAHNSIETTDWKMKKKMYLL